MGSKTKNLTGIVLSSSFANTVVESVPIIIVMKRSVAMSLKKVFVFAMIQSPFDFD